jgi:uncharacterized membrane protein
LVGILAGVVLATAVGPAATAQEDPSVRAVLFFSPTCGHCEYVINEVLPVVFADYGGTPEVLADWESPQIPFYLATNGTFELLLVDVSVPAGAGIYEASTTVFDIPPGMQGVPRLVLGDQYFVGSGDIPAYLSELIADGLESGGVDWPEIDGIPEALEAILPSAEDPSSTETTTTITDVTVTTLDPGTTSTAPPSTEVPATTTTEAGNPFDDIDSGVDSSGLPTTSGDSIGEKFRNDLAGNILAVVVLALMLASLVAIVVLVRRGRLGAGPAWLVPLLAIAGVAVAVYLAYVETSGSEAVCGPVGNCNAVQESKFALLFGMIPIGIIGIIGYAVVIGAWLMEWLGRGPWPDLARVGLAAGAFSGVAFSIYLTFLEPFVIGATCMWCVSSAVIVTALLWLTAAPGWDAWQRLRTGSRA